MRSQFKLHHVNAERLVSDYVERRLGFALGRFAHRIGSVTTAIRADGPRFGNEMTCRISADVQPFGVISAEAVDPDVYAAIDRCAGRLARRCQAKFARPRSRRESRASVRMIETNA